MKKLFLVLVTLSLGTSVAIACPGHGAKQADGGKPVPQQTTSATKT